MLESENQTVACFQSAQSPPPPDPAPPVNSRPLPAARARPPDAPARPPGPDAPPAPCKGSNRRRGTEERKAALGFGPSPSRIQDRDGSGGGRLSLCHPPKDGTRPRLTPARRCQRPLGKSPAVEGDELALEPPPPPRPPLSSRVPLHPQDSVKTQRSTHGPPKREGDAVSHLRSRRRAARRQLGCAGDTKANTTTAARHLGVTTRLPAGALPPQPSPHLLSRRILRRSLQSPRAGGDPGRREGRSAPRGCIREVVSMIGICLPNGTTNTPGFALTDFSSSQ